MIATAIFVDRRFPDFASLIAPLSDNCAVHIPDPQRDFMLL
jgi:hypothetical protein